MPAPQLAQRLRVRLVLPPEHMRALLEASSVVVETVCSLGCGPRDSHAIRVYLLTASLQVVQECPAQLVLFCKDAVRSGNEKGRSLGFPFSVFLIRPPSYESHYLCVVW
jgi:hypothetical protein